MKGTFFARVVAPESKQNMVNDDDDKNEKELELLEHGSVRLKPSKKDLEKMSNGRETRLRRRHILKASLTHIEPSSILFNSLQVASSELARLAQKSMNEELTLSETKKYTMLINAMVKLSEENRNIEQQSHLEGRSEEEQEILVQKAIEALAVEAEIDDDDDS